MAGRCADAALALDGVYGERRTVPLQRPCFPIADNGVRARIRSAHDHPLMRNAFVQVGNVGIPIPEKLVLLVAGVLVARKDLDLGILYVLAILSVVTGDSCGF